MIFATDPAEVFTNEPHVPKAYRFMGELMRKYGKTPLELAQEANVEEDAHRFDFLRYHMFAEQFVANGCPTFVLSHTIAAALTATRAPQFSFGRCPFSAFLVEVPSEFLPLSSAPPRPKRWVSVLVTDTLRAVAIHAKGCGSYAHFQVIDPDKANFDEFYREDRLRGFADPKANLFEMHLAIRIASNAVAFVTTHRESVTRRVGTPSDVRLLDVACPREVCVDRAFRDQVTSLLAARSIPRARGVLAHLVRGHWRSRGDDLLWIAPYRRGDENIGRVAERTERL